MAYCRGVTLPTHILYAHDVLIFCTGLKINIHCLLSIFKQYLEVSGQLINNNKSRFYIGAMMGAREQQMGNMLGFGAGTIPFNYLGCPVFKGKPKAVYILAIFDKIKMKLATWKGSLLSIMGRVQLVKSIIHGMLVYSFHVYMWPTSLLNDLDKWLKNFIWSGDVHTRKLCTVSWSVLCRPWEEGGWTSSLLALLMKL